MFLFLGLALLCLSWLLPDHFVPWTAFQQEWLAALGVAVVGAAVLLRGQWGPVRWPPLALLALACAGIPLAQTAAGQIFFLSDGLLPLLYLLAFALSMVAGATLTSTRRTELLDGLGVAFVVAGFVSTGMAMFQWLQLGPASFISGIAPGARPYANFGQPNNLATLLGLGVVSLARSYENRSINGTVTALGVTWLGFGLLVTQSRTGWLFVALLTGAWAMFRHRASLRVPMPAVVLGALTFCAGVMAWGSVNDALDLRADGLDERLQTGTRPAIWVNLWDALWRSPWVGYGWSQVVLAQQAAALDHPATVGMIHNSHNLVLDLLLWNGVPLGLVLVGALAWWFLRQSRQCGNADHWALLVGVTSVFVHALVEFPLDYAYFLLPVGLMMGVLDGMAGSTPLRRLPAASLAIPLALMTGMLGWVGSEYIRVEDSARQVRLLMAGVGVDRVPTVSPPDVRLLDALREYHRLWITSAKSGMSAAELDWMKTVVRRYPTPPAQLRYALAAGLNGRHEEATVTLARICAMHATSRCVEARESWVRLRTMHPELRRIEMPAAPLMAMQSRL